VRLEGSAFATIAARAAATAATSAAPGTAVSGKSSSSCPSSVIRGTVTAIASNRTVILEGAVLDCENTTKVINRTTGAQASTTTAETAISPLNVKAFDVNVLERHITLGRCVGICRQVGADRKQTRVDRRSAAVVQPLQRCTITLDDDL
jgi:hypothetical protein